MTGLALNCQIAGFSRFARKNYPYPDLMKGYQISQYELPLCADGWLKVDSSAGEKTVRIERVHLEEDTAKLTHAGEYSLIDVNRAGIPLMEIVSHPDMRTPEEAYQYLTKLQQIMRYLGVSTGNMEEGAMRCEANVSVRPAGAEPLGTKVEIKNLNSFRSVRSALDYEIARHIRLLEAGRAIRQVTMGWNEQTGETFLQRSKEEAHNYRYFPEPDLPPLEIDEQWVQTIRARLVELPDARRDRFVFEYGLGAGDATTLVAEREVADYYEACVNAYGDPVKVAHWITGEFFRLLKATEANVADIKISPAAMAELLRMIDDASINQNTGKAVLAEMAATGRSASQVVEQRGLAQISDDTALQKIIDAVINENPDPVQKYREGKEQAMGFLLGQVMRATRGKANPKVAGQLLRRALVDQ